MYVMAYCSLTNHTPIFTHPVHCATVDTAPSMLRPAGNLTHPPTENVDTAFMKKKFSSKNDQVIIT